MRYVPTSTDEVERLEQHRAAAEAAVAGGGCTSGWLAERAGVRVTAASRFLASLGAKRNGATWRLPDPSRRDRARLNIMGN